MSAVSLLINSRLTDLLICRISEGISSLVGVVDVAELKPVVVDPPLLVHLLLEARLVALGVPVITISISIKLANKLCCKFS